MRKPVIFILLAMTLCAGIGAATATDYVIDPEHTSIHFRVGHFNFSQVQGSFNRIRGTFSFDPAKPGASKVHVVVNVGSIDTNHQARDEHMRDSSYFNVARFPEAVFRSTSVTVMGPRTGRLTGDLSIRDVTIPVTLEVKFNGVAPHPLRNEFARYRGVTVAGFSARTTISRTGFGMTNGPDEKGDKAELSIEVEGWQRR